MAPALKRLLVSDILIRFCEQITHAFVVVWCMKMIAQPVSAVQFGLLTSIEMATAVLIYIPVAWLADRGSKKPFVAVTFVLFTCFPLLLMFCQSMEWLIPALPILGGEGAHPPADACDFARWCAGLDFFSINDHAEGLTPALWHETKRSIRECAARATATGRPDLVPFLGWEWTQTGTTADTHFGHRNVVLESLAEDAVPARPIASRVAERDSSPPAFLFRVASAVAHVVAPRPYAEPVDRFGEMAGVPSCAEGTPVRDLPPACLESAATPGDLVRKLDDWGVPALVIPHGLAWGIHAPPAADLRTQLRRAQHDPQRERLLEVMSGHGNGEEYRVAGEGAAGPASWVHISSPTSSVQSSCT